MQEEQFGFEKLTNSELTHFTLTHLHTQRGQVVLEYFVILALLAAITIILAVGGSGNKNRITTALDGYYTKAVNKIAP